MNRGFDSLKVVRKVGRRGVWPFTHRQRSASVIISSLLGMVKIWRGHCSGRCVTTAKAWKHAGICTPMSLTVSCASTRGPLDLLGDTRHSMRATFITTALDNGASLEDVQSAAGHADPSTTKLYDRRGYNPEKSASFFANY